MHSHFAYFREHVCRAPVAVCDSLTTFQALPLHTDFILGTIFARCNDTMPLCR